jgi:membrane-associated PAP2 superfamily phosphatase
MNDHDTDEPFDVPAPGTMEWNVLNRVIGITDDRHPWSVEELIRDLGDALTVTDAINALHGAGLINRAGDLIFPSRAAIVFEQISE